MNDIKQTSDRLSKRFLLKDSDRNLEIFPSIYEYFEFCKKDSSPEPKIAKFSLFFGSQIYARSIAQVASFMQNGPTTPRL